MSLTQYLPPEISEVVQEYEEGSFRIRGENTIFTINDKSYSLPTKSGLWRVTLGPVVYRQERHPGWQFRFIASYRALIFYRVGTSLPSSPLTVQLSEKEIINKQDDDDEGQFYTQIEERTTITLCSQQGVPFFDCRVPGMLVSQAHSDNNRSLIIWAVRDMTAPEIGILCFVYEALEKSVVRALQTWVQEMKQEVEVGRVDYGGITIKYPHRGMNLGSFFTRPDFIEAKLGGHLPSEIYLSSTDYMHTSANLFPGYNVYQLKPEDIAPLLHRLQEMIREVWSIDPNTIATSPQLAPLYNCIKGRLDMHQSEILEGCRALVPVYRMF